MILDWTISALMVSIVLAICALTLRSLGITWRHVKRSLGLKDRLVTRCPNGEHEWYRVYADAILATGSPWHCHRCPYGARDFNRGAKP